MARLNVAGETRERRILPEITSSEYNDRICTRDVRGGGGSHPAACPSEFLQSFLLQNSVLPSMHLCADACGLEMNSPNTLPASRNANVLLLTGRSVTSGAAGPRRPEDKPTERQEGALPLRLPAEIQGFTSHLESQSNAEEKLRLVQGQFSCLMSAAARLG